MKISSKKPLLIILLLGLFLPVFNAWAGPFSIGSITYKAMANVFAYTSYIMFSAIGFFIGLLVDLLYWVVNIRIYTNIPVIQEGWKIMRDFANMLFILALVVMAYGTIFNIQGYDFRSLIAKFLIAALLINFSLVIGGVIIDATQVLNNTFLTAMGNISDRLGQDMETWKLLPNAAQAKDKAEAFSSLFFSSFVTILFAIFLAFAFLISVAVPLVVAFVRIPILWALLIISPMAWLLSILPATKSAYDKWWHQFLGWTLFLPYYLFFLYFALFFLSKKNEVMAGLGQTFVNDQVTGMTGLQSDFTFGLIFYYLLVAVFLIGGTKVAMSAGKFSGTGIVSVAKWGRGVAMDRFGVTATRRAAQQKWAEVQKEGLPGKYGGMIYGGERALDEQTARMARRFWVRGADIKVQQAFLDSAGKEYNELETKHRLGQVSIDQIKKTADSGPATDARVYAARKMLAKTGQLDADISQKTFSELKDNALAMEDFAKTASGARWSNMSRTNVRAVAKGSTFTDANKKTYDYSSLRKSPSGTAARREAVKHVQDDKRSITDIRHGSEFDMAELKEYITLLGGPTTYEADKLIKSVGKYRPDLIWDLSRDPAYSSIVPGRITSKAELVTEAVDVADNETLAFMPITLWTTPEFQTALTGRYERRGAAIADIRAGAATPNTDQVRFKTSILDVIMRVPDSSKKTTIIRTLLP